MYLTRFVILIQTMSVCLSFDIELEGMVRVGNDLLDKINLDPVDDTLPHSIKVRTKGKLPKIFSRSAIMRATLNSKNRSDEIVEYTEHVKKRGAIILKNIGKQIMKEMKLLDQNFTEYINAASEDYLLTMQSYFEYICEQRTKTVIDDDLILLDMVETAYRLLYRENRKLLNDAITFANTTTHDKVVVEVQRRGIQTISHAIYKESIKTKKEEMRHICNKYEVCRPYPALTDYLADYIVEILRLPEQKLQTFMKLMRILAKSNEDFFNIITQEDDRKEIVIQMNEVLSDFNSIQETLSVMRAVLTQRFKIIHSPNLRLKMRTKAVRILLDIIDKAFQYEYEDITAMEFDSAVRAMRLWLISERPFPESVITRLINNILKILEYNLSKNARKEINVLIESIMKGSSKNEEVYNYLFRDGSKFVRGEDFHSDIEII